MKIYIAGPWSTSGEPGPNLHAAANAAAELLERGHFPFVPHTVWILHAVRPDVPITKWIEWDLAWLQDCDALLRLPGKSRGADLEVALANEIGIPVYESIEDIDDGSEQSTS